MKLNYFLQISLSLSLILNPASIVAASPTASFSDRYRDEFYAAALIAEARSAGKQQVIAQLVAFSEGVQANPDKAFIIDQLIDKAVERGRNRKREVRNGRIESMQEMLTDDVTGEFFSDLASLAPVAGGVTGVTVKWLDRANRSRRYNQLEKLKQPLHEAISQRIASESDVAEKLPGAIAYLIQNADQHPEYLKFLSHVGREVIDVEPTASISEIAAASNNHMLGQLLQGLIGPDGKIDPHNLNREMKMALEQVNQSLRQDLEEIKARQLTIGEALNKFNERLDDESAAQAERLAEKNEGIRRNLKNSEINASFELLALLSPDPKARATLRALGAGTIQISESIRRFKLFVSNPLNEDGIGTLAMVTSIGGAVSSILGAIFGSKSTDQMILDEIRKTQDMVVELGKYCQQRFDQLNELVIQVYDQLSAQLRAILTTGEDSKASLSTLHQSIEDLMDQQLGLQSRIDGSLKLLQDKELSEKINKCFNQPVLQSSGTTIDFLQDCLETFFIYATVHSTESRPGKYLKADFRASAESFPKGLGANFPNFMAFASQVLTERDNYGFVSGIEVSRDAVNPLEWAAAAQKIIDFALVHQDTGRLIQADRLDQVIELGQNIANSIKSLGIPKNSKYAEVGESPLTSSPIGKAIALYEHDLENTIKSIDLALQEKSRRRYNDVNLWAAADQVISPTLGKIKKTIPLCNKKTHGLNAEPLLPNMSKRSDEVRKEITAANKKGFAGIKSEFNTPEDLINAIPNVARVAYQLGLPDSDLSACVSSVGFTDARECSADDPKEKYIYRWCSRLAVNIDGFSGKKRLFTWTIKGPEFERVVRTANYKPKRIVTDSRGHSTTVPAVGRFHSLWHEHAIYTYWPQAHKTKVNTPDLSIMEQHQAVAELKAEVEEHLPLLQDKVSQEVYESLNSEDGSSKILGQHIKQLADSYALLLGMLFYTQGQSMAYDDSFYYAVTNRSNGLVSYRSVVSALKEDPALLGVLLSGKAGGDAMKYITRTLLEQFDTVSFSQPHPWLDPTLKNLRSYRSYLHSTQPKLSITEVLGRFWRWVEEHLQLKQQ